MNLLLWFHVSGRDRSEFFGDGLGIYDLLHCMDLSYRQWRSKEGGGRPPPLKFLSPVNFIFVPVEISTIARSIGIRDPFTDNQNVQSGKSYSWRCE